MRNLGAGVNLRALAGEVLDRGDCAAVAARRTQPLRELVAGSHEGLVVELDITDAQARDQAVGAVLDRFGRIDVLANIAGRGSLGAAEEFSPEQLRDQMELNFFAAAELTRLVLPAMRAQGSGHILQLTSIGGLVGYPAFSAYCASKFALEGWSEALREEVAPLGIRVTIVEPGAFRTDFAGVANMRPARRVNAYRKIVDDTASYLYGSDGKQPGDPVRAAEAIDADLDRWKAIGEATAFETRPIRENLPRPPRA